MRPLPPASSTARCTALGLVLLLVGALPWAGPITADEDGAAEGPVALARSAHLRYAVTRAVKDSKGKLKTHKDRARGVWGHALVEGRLWRPAAPTHRDLPFILGFTLPEGAASMKVKEDLRFTETVPVRLKGTVTSSEDGRSYSGSFTFSSAKKGERGDIWRVSRGKAEVKGTYDPELKRPTQIEIALTYRRGKIKPERGEDPTLVDDVRYTLTLDKHIPRRPKDFDDNVGKAIDKGVMYLRSIQIKPPEDHAGAFKPYGTHHTGSTALALLTLAACDVSRNDAAITEGLRYLVENPPTKTYARSLTLMAIDKIYAKKAGGHERMLPDVRDLAVAVLEALLKSANSPGTWGYPAVGNSTLRFDTSNTQYAVLGLRAAARLGLEVPESAWLGAIRYVKQLRGPSLGAGRVHLTREGQAALDDGRYATVGPPPESSKEVAGFRYATLDNYREPYGSMTAAGIACLAIAREQLALRGSKKLNAKLQKEIRALMTGGWIWLDRHWAVDRHPHSHGARWYYYWLYSLERAAILDGVKRVSGRDWYFEGAQELLMRQGKDGGWPRSGAVRVSRTCFALLFLKRATAPISGPITGG